MPSADPGPKASGIPTSRAEAHLLPAAWQPVTPRGVAAFASARVGRLLSVQLAFAGLVAGAVCWFLSTAWLPTVKRALQQLPETGGITNGVLVSPRRSTQPLAQSHFIAFVVDVQERTGADVPTDMLVTFRSRDVRICSVLGCATRLYDKHWRIPLSRVEAEAAWGAWRSTLFVAVVVSVISVLFASWFVLALLACPLVRLYAFFKDRHITLWGSWKLSAAALLPGGLVASGLVVLYGLELIDLVRFLIGWCLHFFVAGIYLLAAPLRVPRVPQVASTATNPFAGPPQATSGGSEP